MLQGVNHKGKPAYGIWLAMPAILLLWGSFAAVSKLTLGSIDSFQLQFLMFGISSVILTAWIAVRRGFGEIARMRAKDVGAALLCGLPYYLYYFLYTLALKMIPATEASMLNYLFPVMIVLFAIPINRERLTPLKAASMLLGLAGAVLLLTGGKITGLSFTNLAGDLLALGGAVAWGLFSNFGKRNRAGTTASIWLYTVESFALSCVSLACFSRPALPGLLPLAGAAWIGLSNVVLSLPLWLFVLKSAPTAFAASFSFVTPFVTLLFIVLLTGERVQPGQLAGFLVIVGSIVLLNLPSLFRRKAGSTIAG